MSFANDYPNVVRLLLLVGFVFFVRFLVSYRQTVYLSASLDMTAVTKRLKRDNLRRKYKSQLQQKIPIDPISPTSTTTTNSASPSPSPSSTTSLPPLPSSSAISQLLSLSASQLSKAISIGSISSADAVYAYSLRALAIGEKTNAVTEENYIEAIKKGMEVDKMVKAKRENRSQEQEKKEKRDQDGSSSSSSSNSNSNKSRSEVLFDPSDSQLLLGVPISLKDQVNQVGFDSTMGLACRCFHPSDHNGLLLQLLLDQGAIPFVRSNTQQSMLLPESANIVYGVTKNAWNAERTSGGSSGGEGTLIAAGGSVLGVGTDIGGSIRIPAHFSGCVGFKPSPNRITLKGLSTPRVNNVSGQSIIIPSAGPLCNSVDDAVLMMRSWLVDLMWDNDIATPRLPFNLDEYNSKSKLTIGYYEHDGIFPASPACSRGVREAVAILKAKGHTLVEWSPPEIETAIRLYYGLMAADGSEAFRKGLEGENPHSYYKTLIFMSKLPRIAQTLLGELLKRSGENRVALVMSATGAKSAFEYQSIIAESKLYISRFLDSWHSNSLDCVICPAAALPAYCHGESKDLTLSHSYTFLYNLLPFPAGVVPITRVKKEKGEEEYTAESVGEKGRQGKGKEFMNDGLAAKARKVCEGSDGLPIGVQVAGLTWNDEMVLRVMKELEEGIGWKEQSPLKKELDVFAIPKAE